MRRRGDLAAEESDIFLQAPRSLAVRMKLLIGDSVQFSIILLVIYVIIIFYLFQFVCRQFSTALGDRL